MKVRGLLSPENKYLTIGHSMGGAIAALLAFIIYNETTKNIRSFGFGSAACGDLKFSKFACKFCHTIVNGFDIVPAASFHALRVQMQRLLKENEKKFTKRLPHNNEQIFNMN